MSLISTRVAPIATSQKSLDSSITSAMIYDVRGLDYIQFQLIASGAWPGSLVITAQGCIGDTPTIWGGFPTAVTRTSDGIEKLMHVSGIDWVRWYVSTTAGTITVEVLANGLREVGP